MLAKLLVSSSLTVLTSQITLILAEQNLKKDHPDVLYLEAGEKLGVEAVKKIRGHLKLKPAMAKQKAVVLESAEDLTPEAQNALLKTLEEPAGEVLILLGTNSEEKLLPTVLSRCEIVYLTTDSTPEVSSYITEIEKLLKSNVAERFTFIEKLEDKEGFLQALTSYFRQPQTLASNLSGSSIKVVFLSDLLQANIWARQNVNLRAILEYLMLKLPIGLS